MKPYRLEAIAPDPGQTLRWGLAGHAGPEAKHRVWKSLERSSTWKATSPCSRKALKLLKRGAEAVPWLFQGGGHWLQTVSSRSFLVPCSRLMIFNGPGFDSDDRLKRAGFLPRRPFDGLR